MTYRIQLHKERLQKMLMLINTQELIEETFDDYPDHVKQKEDEMIMEYCAEFAALNQLAFNQIKESNARAIGNIVVDESGKATGCPTLDLYSANLI